MDEAGPPTAPSPRGRRRTVVFALTALGALVCGFGILALIWSAREAALREAAVARDLEQAGRTLQTAFAGARRAAIVGRRRHHVVLAHGPTASGDEVVQLHILAAGGGYVTRTPFALPAGVHLAVRTGATLPAEIRGAVDGCGATVFEGAPRPDDRRFFDADGAPAAGLGFIAFEADGTIEMVGSATDLPGTALDAPPTAVGEPPTDLRLGHAQSERWRAEVDIAPDTGRVRFRTHPGR